MKKVKAFMLEHKVFFTVLFVAISLLGLEYVIVNNYVDKKTNPKKTRTSNIVSNINDLDSKQKKILGIASNSNQTNESSESKTNTIFDEKKDEKINEKSNSNVNKKYIEYEKKSDEEKEKIEVIPSKEQVGIDELKDINSSDKSVFPKKYDLSEIITFNYQNQNSYGLCWDFASTKVFESYLELRDKKHYNFSEIVVDYLASDLLYSNRKLHNGGNFEYYNRVVNKLGGLVEEKDITKDYEYSYSLEEYMNFFNLPKVKIEGYEVVHFPTLIYDSSDNKFYDGEESVTDEELVNYRNAIKNHITNNSAVYASINVFDSSTVNERIKNKNNLPTGEYADIPPSISIYCTEDLCQDNTNHAVAIVGWDDNFDRKAFRKIDSTTGEVKFAEHNGAFLALDSNNDVKSYYYISYDYPYLYEDLYGIKTFDTTTGYDLSKLKNKDFKQALMEEFDDSLVYLNNSIYLPYSKIEARNYLSLKDINLTEEDLNLLSLFTNIEYLDFNNVTLSNINFLKNYSKLELLIIENSNISDISVLSNLSNLKVLDLANNNIFDISSIENLTELENLSLAHNNITDISAIKNLDKLEDLILDDNNITISSDTFDNLVELGILSLANCGLSSLTLNPNISYQIIDISENPNIQISNNISVYSLYIDKANLNNLDILSNVNKDTLYSLSLENNDISDISALLSFKKLSSLNLSYNKNISNFSPIITLFKNEKNNNSSNYTSFFHGYLSMMMKKYDEDHIEVNNDEDNTYYEPGDLYLNGCNISDISIFNNLNIYSLELADNNITSVTNFDNNNIEYLDLSNNNLENSDISVLFSNNIDDLYLSNTGIKDFNFKISKESINTLDLSNNDITDISNLKNTKIELLSLEGNTNFKNYPENMKVYLLNLSNTAVDETIVDNLNLHELLSVNFSSNKNISDYSQFMDKLYNKAHKIMDEKEEDDNYYVFFDVIVSDVTLDNIRYSKYVNVYTNYEISMNTVTNFINLATSEYYPLFKFLVENIDVKLNNIELNKSYTKLTVNDINTSYIEFENAYGESYKISFK